ncbi:PREDICTED: protein canopy homolog 2 [Ceratosolen solmsi marchali]|uniref:Protein canopy homolog 2 n=1 Tax=Ceratosolen solmsi marchali TaxID=326594 RepID=A0AAJ7DY55_9HYME|nr:PREDICTED: protein canopy homolog 2 [Ceratosolen solmsi marchali]
MTVISYHQNTTYKLRYITYVIFLLVASNVYVDERHVGKRMNRMKLLIPFVFLILSTTTAHLNLKHVKCLVCRIIVDEFEKEVGQIDPKKKIEIGQYRLDPAGNTLHKHVPMTRSEVHLSEMLDNICKKMEDYVRARYKSNGRLTILKLMTESGLNPLLRDVDIIQDGDLNKSLEYFCEDVVNDNEETFIKVMGSKEEDAKTKICTEMADYCTEFIDELDDSDATTEADGVDESEQDNKPEQVETSEQDNKSEKDEQHDELNQSDKTEL